MAHSTVRIRIPPIAEEVDVHLRHAHLLGHFHKRLEMVDMAVHAPITDQSQQMQPPIPVLRSLEAFDQVLHFVHLALLDRLIDPHNILPHHSACTDVQVSDFRVTHQTFREADCERRGLEFGVALGEFGAVFRELVHPWCFGVEDGVAFRWRVVGGDAPAVYAYQRALVLDFYHDGRDAFDNGRGD